MNRVLFFLLLVLASANLSGQYISSVTVPEKPIANHDAKEDHAFRYAQTITPDDMRVHLTILASDEYEGRETGERGNEMAAKYIAQHFKGLGLPAKGLENSYYQKVNFIWTSWENTELYVNGNKYKHLWDYLTFPDQNMNVPNLVSDEVVFLGYGIDDPKYSDYKKSVAGKVIMIYAGEPRNSAGVSRVTGSTGASEWDMEKKLKLAKSKGVKEVLIITENIKGMLAENRRKLLGPSISIGGDVNAETELANATYISTTIAKEIMGKKFKKVIRVRDRMIAKGKSKSVCLKTGLNLVKERNVSTLDGNNVLGYIEGTDKKEELIVISGHYDHLGKRGDGIYNGADDNGSGTTTVLEIAEAFSMAKSEGHGPRRSVLCLLVTGEEKGLLGSAYYAENPVFELENTVCNINVDMVGRVDEKYEDNHDYIYVIGSDRLSTDLHKINERQNEIYGGMTLDYTYNSESDPNRYYFRSDHYNFAKNGIPAIFFFNGTHADYHRTTDTVDKIEFDKMAKVGRLIFHTAWEVANREARIVVDGEVKEGGR